MRLWTKSYPEFLKCFLGLGKVPQFLNIPANMLIFLMGEGFLQPLCLSESEHPAGSTSLKLYPLPYNKDQGRTKANESLRKAD